MKQRGASEIALCIFFLVILIFFFVIVGVPEKNNNGETTKTTTSSLFSSKEPRSTYIPKCTTISYEALARNPNQYINNDYTFTGQVIQVMNDNKNVALRVNVTPKRYEYMNETLYEDTILVAYQYSSDYESKILENDIVTIYGKFTGLYTYDAVLGNSITVPSIKAMYIDIKK